MKLKENDASRYAYIRIALYGKPYIDSAKDTYHFFKERGLDALANDCLVNIGSLRESFILFCSI